MKISCINNIKFGVIMIRFRNPGTEYATQIQVLKLLYANLGKQEYFTLDDMAVVIANGRMMTAYGYAGEAALKLSNTPSDSMNSAKMNAKMYAEVFRMLGWVTPYGNKSSYPLVFTYIGVHVALSEGDISLLYEQCVLGIVNPNQLSDRMSYSEKVRFFKCALRSFIDLGGVMYKHELCLGPMSVNDQSEKEYSEKIAYIKGIRGNYKNLQVEFQRLSDSLGMKTSSVDNCTRLPIAFMKSCNWVESVSNSSLYGKTLDCLRITHYGIEVYNTIKVMHDVRLEEFMSYDEKKKKSMIRLGIYRMLYRSGYDISAVTDKVEYDQKYCGDILQGKDILFSPYQMLRNATVNDALGFSVLNSNKSVYSVHQYESSVLDRHAAYKIKEIELITSSSSLNYSDDENNDVICEMQMLKKSGYSSKQIVDKIFNDYRHATQSDFYPIVVKLFRLLGLNCVLSRPGDNGSRWDAIIVDRERSIPIEIKSPTEQEHLSVKAIRQALENKIVLLSRKTYKTKPDVTSLAVGYYMPNERAEVNSLIVDIRSTFGYKIAVIDFYSLIVLATKVTVESKTFDKEVLYYMEGLYSANI